MKRTAIVVAALLTLSACAETTAIVKTGQDTYMLSKRGATGWSPIESLRVDVLQQAGAFCVQQGKSLQVFDTEQSHPPYLAGNFPRVTIQFKCI